MATITKQQILAESTFGDRVAEDESEHLRSYFVETEQWRKVNNGSVDIIFGAKGAGKSALYSLLVSQKERFRLGRRTVFIAAENPRGAVAFQDLAASPPSTEEQFRAMWKLYFLSLAANYLRHQFVSTGTSNDDGSNVIDILTKNGLLAPNLGLRQRLGAVLEYVRKYIPTLEAGMTDPGTGIKWTGKITLKEPSGEARESGFVSADALLTQLDAAFKQCDISVWLLLDRLDVAFTDSPELESVALRALFRAYLDMLALTNIDAKIFLRDDIWRRITKEGFREASHVTRSITLSWDEQSLLNLIVRRMLHNPTICAYYQVSPTTVLASSKLQSALFYRMFPDQVDIGKNQPSTLDWMTTRTADASKMTAPRELIHLLQVIRDEQLKALELGAGEPPEENLIDRASIRAALPTVSKTRFQQTLCAEYPGLKGYVERLERERTQQTPESLARIWECPAQKAAEIAEHLADAGFFERRGSKEVPAYWVPFLYRDALQMVQGSA